MRGETQSAWFMCLPQGVWSNFALHKVSVVCNCSLSEYSKELVTKVECKEERKKRSWEEEVLRDSSIGRVTLTPKYLHVYVYKCVHRCMCRFWVPPVQVKRRFLRIAWQAWCHITSNVAAKVTFCYTFNTSVPAYIGTWWHFGKA